MEQSLEHDNRKVADAIKESWVYRLIPLSLWPYAQLARWERPIGWWLLMWPGWWAIMLAQLSSKADAIAAGATASGFVANLSETADGIFLYLILFLLGAVAMRGAGCTL